MQLAHFREFAPLLVRSGAKVEYAVIELTEGQAICYGEKLGPWLREKAIDDPIGLHRNATDHEVVMPAHVRVECHTSRPQN